MWLCGGGAMAAFYIKSIYTQHECKYTEAGAKEGE